MWWEWKKVSISWVRLWSNLLCIKGTLKVVKCRLSSDLKWGGVEWSCLVMTQMAVCLLCAQRACYGVLRFIMESGAKGCEVVVSGKLRGQRAKSIKFVDGLMIHSGDPVNYYVDTAVRHVLLRQGE